VFSFSCFLTFLLFTNVFAHMTQAQPGVIDWIIDTKTMFC